VKAAAVLGGLQLLSAALIECEQAGAEVISVSVNDTEGPALHVAEEAAPLLRLEADHIALHEEFAHNRCKRGGVLWCWLTPADVRAA
jgi:hypothetical protein